MGVGLVNIRAVRWGRLAGTLEVGDLAVLAIIAYRLAPTTNKSDPLLWAIAAAVCAVTAISKTGHHQAERRRSAWLRQLSFERLAAPQLRQSLKLASAQPACDGGMFWFRWNRLVGS